MVAALFAAAASVGGIDHLVASVEDFGWHDLWWAVPLAVILRRTLARLPGSADEVSL
jgi:hypothetical protein